MENPQWSSGTRKEVTGTTVRAACLLEASKETGIVQFFAQGHVGDVFRFQVGGLRIDSMLSHQFQNRSDAGKAWAGLSRKGFRDRPVGALQPIGPVHSEVARDAIDD